VAVFSVVFEWQGEGSGEVNGLAHAGPRRLADNQDRVHATTWRGRSKGREQPEGATPAGPATVRPRKHSDGTRIHPRALMLHCMA
jgi:hypothetical protein